MTKEDLKLITDILAKETLYAAMVYYDFKEVKDTKFHELRNEYIKLGDKLNKYIETQSKD